MRGTPKMLVPMLIRVGLVSAGSSGYFAFLAQVGAFWYAVRHGLRPPFEGVPYVSTAGAVGGALLVLAAWLLLLLGKAAKLSLNQVLRLNRFWTRVGVKLLRLDRWLAKGRRGALYRFGVRPILSLSFLPFTSRVWRYLKLLLRPPSRPTARVLAREVGLLIAAQVRILILVILLIVVLLVFEARLSDLSTRQVLVLSLLSVPVVALLAEQVLSALSHLGRPTVNRWVPVVGLVLVLVMSFVVTFTGDSYARFLRSVRCGGDLPVVLTINDGDRPKIVEKRALLLRSRDYLMLSAADSRVGEVPLSRVERLEYAER